MFTVRGYLESLPLTRHGLWDWPSVRNVLQTVAGYYGAKITIPDHSGYGTALGALRWMMSES